MCGRFTLKSNQRAVAEAFDGVTPPLELPPRYNIAPSQPVAVIANTDEKVVDYFIWGLIPSWAKDGKIGNRLINARSETVAEKPSFRTAYRRRRCLILADGFYEWQKNSDKSKTPVYIQLKSQNPFAFAGLWEEWFSPHGDRVLSCTIITTMPNQLMAPIHNRMPVILPPESYNRWLIPDEQPVKVLQPLLKPFPSEFMTAYPVSTYVNNPRNDSQQCIVPQARLL
jgi:putative SOS response-associated peptidase YedK